MWKRSMRNCKSYTLFLISGIIILSLMLPTRAQAQTVPHGDEPDLIVLVRHAETNIPEPGNERVLTADGHKRAQDLVAALRQTKFSAIITTQFVRTQQTAQPISAALGITPELIGFDPMKIAPYMAAFKDAMRKHAGKAVLVVGHQFSVPPIIAGFGGPQLPFICENRFDNLFVLAPRDGGPHLVHSRYGAISPAPASDCM
jgi:phosphohistidine phosphatase SixA